MVTKNRIGNALAVVAAVIGLVLVFSGAGHGDRDDAPAAPPPASQVQAPAPGQPAPAQPAAPTAGQPQAPAPAAPPKKDDDGDDDG